MLAGSCRRKNQKGQVLRQAMRDHVLQGFESSELAKVQEA